MGSGVVPDHALRCRALSLVLPPGAVFVSWSAAALHGVARWPVLAGDLPGLLDRSTRRYGRTTARRVLALADRGAE